MRRWLPSLLLPVSLLVAACGDSGERVNAEGPTTTNVGTSPPAFCVPEEDHNDYTAGGAAIDAKQAELRADLDKARAYGEAHPDEFNLAGFDNWPDVVLVATFSDHVDAHRAGLLALVEHKDRLEVRKAVQSARAAAALQAQIDSDPRTKGTYRSLGSGTLVGALQIDFVASNKGKTAADYVLSNWPDVTCVTVGGRPYPDRGDADTCAQYGAIKTDRNPDVEFVLELESKTIVRGEVGHGVAHITNHGTTTLEHEIGSGLTAWVLRPGSDDVAGIETGPHTDPLFIARAEPGQTIDENFTFGTEDCRGGADYALPAGEYTLTSYIPNFGRATDVTITVTED